MFLLTYWPKDGDPNCHKGQYIQNFSCVKNQLIFISIECGVGYNISKTTTPYQNLSLLNFITPIKSEKHLNCVLTQGHQIIIYGYSSE
jgi:hypothetical protein